MLRTDGDGQAVDPAPHTNTSEAKEPARKPDSSRGGRHDEPKPAPESKPAKTTGSGFSSFES